MTTSSSFYLTLLIICLAASSNADDDPYRLPTGVVKVEHYNLQLTLQDDVFDTHIFNGELYLTFTPQTSINEIKLHSSGLTFSNVYLFNQAAAGDFLDITNDNFDSDPETEILTIKTATTLENAQTYVLHFIYTGQLRTDEMYGFYQSTYTDVNGTMKYLATTQLQSTYARRVFPCFDEPSVKAVFDIAIRHPSQYSARGNTARTETPDLSNDGFVITTFASTPPMSTYLVAFIVSEYICEPGENIDTNIPYEVCSRPESVGTRNLAVEKGPSLLQALEEFTGISYSFFTLGKLDQFAIPDFAAGAMENWGLVTYRETALLWDEEESSNRYKQRIETVIAHEFAHFWFGDLVTTHWWSDTFLNEGFATYFEFFATAVIEPTWELDKQFVIEIVHPALVSDASPSSLALSSPASTPAEVSARFSTISYNKGGAIFRMVEHFMGTNNFKSGINSYLQSRRFDIASPDNLWASLQVSATSSLPSGDSLANVMASWVTKPGFPLLHVSLYGRTINIHQQRFLTSGTPDDSERWYVPITYTTSSDTNKFQSTATREWFRPNQSFVSLENILADDSSWIVLNNQQIGYYRVNYDDVLWDRISTALNQPGFDGIIEINRAQLVDDLYNLARTGNQSYTRLFDFLKFLSKDTSYAPWYAAFTAFNNMLMRTANEQIRILLSDYVLSLVENLYNSVLFDDPKDHNQIYTHNRVQTQTWACRLGLEHCVKNAKAAFEAYRDSNMKVDKNLRSIVYCNGLRYSDNMQTDYDFLWQLYNNTNLATEQITILQALGCTTNRTLLNDFLSRSITPNSGIRTQDALSVFSSVYTNNVEGVDIALEFLLANHQAITSFYTSMNSLNNLVTGLANRFTKQDQLDKLSNFLNTTLGLPEDLIIAGGNALEMAKNNLEFIESFETQLSLYFRPTSTSSGLNLKGGWAVMIVLVVAILY